jgi:hypothetical protein
MYKSNLTAGSIGRKFCARCLSLLSGGLSLANSPLSILQKILFLQADFSADI